MEQVRGADLLMDTLARAGVDHIFGCSGDSVLAMYDALYSRKDIRYVGVRHEQVAVHMADAYARATGKPGCFMVHVGPGAMNTTLGIATAWKDDVPIIGLIAQQEQHKLGRDVFHEIDQLAMFKPITKWAQRVTRVADVGRSATEAINQAMSGRRGPVILELPKDVVRDSVPADKVVRATNFVPYMSYKPRPAPAALQAAKDLMLSAQNPVILAGAGIHWSESWSEFAQMIRLLGCPVVTTNHGRGVIPETDPQWGGFPGTFGMVTGGKVMKAADVLLAIGTKISDNCSAEWKLIDPDAKIIHVEIDPLMLGKYLPPTVAIHADAKAFIEDFTAVLQQAGLKPKSDAEIAKNPQIQRKDAWIKEERDVFFAPGKENLPKIQPQYLIQECIKHFPKNINIVTGGGAHRIYTDRVPLTKVNSYFKSIDFGSLGFAFPGALGVKMARPDEPVVCMIGDGDLMMCIQDLETAVRENIGVVTVVFNNQGFQSTKHFQKIFFNGRTFGNDFGNPDFAELARVFGADGYRVDKLEQFVPALKKALDAGRPAMIDVHTDPDAAPYEIALLVAQMKTLVGV